MNEGRCFACKSRACNYRIHTADGEFDEVACRRHGKQLEAYADALLGAPGKARMHTISSDRVKRARAGHAESFAEFDRQLKEAAR